MLKKIRLYKQMLFVLTLLVSFSYQAQAAVIEFDPSNQQVAIGDSVSVNLAISDLDSDILSGFDIDVGYDNTILQYESFEFGTDLDIFGLGSLQFANDWGGGAVNVFELSFDFDEDLELFQPDDFVLGTFSFSTLTLGSTALDVGYMQLSGAYDEFGFATEVVATVESGSVTVVPAPATLAILCLGLVGLGFGRRKRIQ